VQLEISDEGGGNGYDNTNEDSIDVTIDSGSTSTNEALSYTASCSQYSENNENYDESYELDQQGTFISNNTQYEVIGPNNFDVNAGTDGNGKGNTPDPCN
jgi:hypothetical protein